MKILLLALQRTGSKLVHCNINRYLDVIGNSTKLLSDGQECSAPWYEPRNHIAAKLLTDCKTIDFVKKTPYQEYNKVFSDRIPLMKSLKGDCCVKVHYFRGFTNELLEFSTYFDHIIILKRRDTFQQLLSFMLSVYSGSWQATDVQKEFIEKTSAKQIRINEHDWSKVVRQFISFKHISDDRATTVYFEDLIHIKNPEHYAQALGLPKLDGFELDTNNWVEFGESKDAVITNIPRLQQIYNDIALMKY